MRLLLDSKLRLQFQKTSQILNMDLDLDRECLLYENYFIIFAKTGERHFFVDISEASVGSINNLDRFKFDSQELLKLDQYTRSWIVINILNLAIYQWKGIAEFRGNSVCRSINKKVEREIGRIPVKFRLNMEGLDVSKSEEIISYEELLEEVIRSEVNYQYI